MPLPSFLRRLRAGAALDPATLATDPAALAQARTRARQRLIGAAVLVLAAVIGFPLLFDSEPRPVPQDLSVRVSSASADEAPIVHKPALTPPAQVDPVPAVVPAPAPSAGTGQSANGRAGELAGRTDRMQLSGPKAQAPERAASAVRGLGGAAPPVLASSPAARSGDGERARALLEGRTPADAGPKVQPGAGSAPASARYVVQIGAFSEVAAARETRLKVEKLGLKTYTQVVESPAGRRIRVRVGPFGDRSEAEQAAGKLRQAGLTAAILAL